MNWEELRKKNPESWDKFTTWNFINGNIYVKSPFDFLAQEFNWQKGILYDFFDENGINILLTCEFDFGFEILENRYEVIIEVKKWYNSRKAAEAAAFTRAFEILENKTKPK